MHDDWIGLRQRHSDVALQGRAPARRRVDGQEDGWPEGLWRLLRHRRAIAYGMSRLRARDSGPVAPSGARRAAPPKTGRPAASERCERLGWVSGTIFDTTSSMRREGSNAYERGSEARLFDAVTCGSSAPT
jgi:hypothetical protein